MTRDREEALKRTAELLDRGVLVPFSERVTDPLDTGLVFFGSIPGKLLKGRERLLDSGEDARPWTLVAERDLGAEWRDDLAALGVDLIVVPDIDAAREAVLRPSEVERLADEYERSHPSIKNILRLYAPNAVAARVAAYVGHFRAPPHFTTTNSSTPRS